MTTARTVLTAMGALTALFAAAPVRSLPVDQYLKLRRQSGYDPRLTYSQIQTNPAAYVGRVLELRGAVEGFIRREQHVSFLLTLEDKGGVLLDAPPADTDIVSSPNRQRLRVLARVSDKITGNVAPLETLAIAYDAEVRLREREAAAKMAAANTRRYAYRAAVATPSRGYRARPMAGGAVPGGLSERARRYLSPEAQAIYPAYKQFIYGCNPRLTADELDLITVSILHFSQRFRVDPRLVVAMIIAESNFNPRATSPKGAMGLGQLMPGTARTLRLSNPYDPVQNVMGAVDHLKTKLNLFREGATRDGEMTWNQVVLALAAYNAGTGAVRKHGGVPPYRETQNYIRRVLHIYSQLIGQGR